MLRRWTEQIGCLGIPAERGEEYLASYLWGFNPTKPLRRPPNEKQSMETWNCSLSLLRLADRIQTHNNRKRSYGSIRRCQTIDSFRPANSAERFRNDQRRQANVSL